MQLNFIEKDNAEQSERLAGPKIFGRKAVKLSQSQKEMLEDFFPQVEIPFGTGVVDIDSHFDSEGPLHLEIGFGNGDYTATLAGLCPGHRIIGCEIFKNGISNLLKSIREAGLNNIRIIEGNAVAAIRHMFAHETFDFVHINHPDPWPKKRHHKRRLIQPQTVKTFTEALKEGGEVWLSTDISDYADWMEESFKGVDVLEKLPAKGRYLDQLSGQKLATRYEKKGLAHGRETRFLRYRKKPKPSTR